MIRYYHLLFAILLPFTFSACRYKYVLGKAEGIWQMSRIEMHYYTDGEIARDSIVTNGGGIQLAKWNLMGGRTDAYNDLVYSTSVSHPPSTQVEMGNNTRFQWLIDKATTDRFSLRSGGDFGEPYYINFDIIKLTSSEMVLQYVTADENSQLTYEEILEFTR